MLLNGFYLETTHQAILATLAYLAARHSKKYCYPSQETLLKLLKRHHGIEICRRTLNYYLKDLEDNKLIERYVRRYRRADGSLVFRTTGYYVLWTLKIVMKKATDTARYLFSLFRVQGRAHNNSTTHQNIEKKTIGEPPAGAYTPKGRDLWRAFGDFLKEREAKPAGGCLIESEKAG